jgi:hypothetical protein
MMRTSFLAGTVLACAATAFAAQTGPTPASALNTPVKPLVISGCIQRSDVDANQFTLLDATDGTIYRLDGADLRPHTGRRVRIVGALVPSANVAAQAGAIDPAQAAVATANQDVGAGASAPLKFHITRVRPLSGTCTQP